MKYITPLNQSGVIREVHASQRQAHIKPVSAPLYVITAIQNPARTRVRYELYRAFEKHMADSGAILYTVELALRDRHFEVTDPVNPCHLQLRSPHQMWHKENLLNILMRRLPEDWEYVAWIDADIVFQRPDWAVETVHLLQHYKIIQLFSHAIDLGPRFEPIKTFQSFMSSFRSDAPFPRLVNSKDPLVTMQWGVTNGIQGMLGRRAGLL
jgi:hypothetical protein